jgi:signal transduction histidine kinase
MRRSIRTRLLLAFIALAIGPLLLVGAVVGSRSFSVQQQEALNLQKEIALRVSTQITSFLQRFEDDLNQVIRVRGLKDLDRKQQDSLFSEMLAYQKGFDTLVLLNNAGQEQVYVSRTSIVGAGDLHNRSQEDVFKVPMSTGKIYYGPVRLDKTTGEPLMTIAIPVIEPRSGLADNILVADIRFKPVWDLIASIPTHQDDDIYLIDAMGNVIAHREPSVVLKGTHFTPPSDGGIHSGLNGTNVVSATNTFRLGEQQFTLVAERGASDALALAIDTVILTVLIVVVVFIIASAIGYTTVTRFIRPIQALAATAQTITAGDLSKRAKIGSADEIGNLAKAFNQMTAQLQQTLEGLQQHVSELEKAKLERERLIRDLREASRLKSEFLSTMSHELRTPLNAMIGFTELMLAGVAGPMTDKQKHQLGRVHANSLRLLSLIDDVLDLSRIEAGRVDIQEEPFSPREMVAKVAAQTSSLAERKALRFVQKIDEGMPETMLGDQARVEQVILNLLSNAFKFTSQGEVELSVKALPESQQWVLSVRDTGVGIPPHAQEYIFEEFRQVDGSSRRVYGGSGLGLAICRNLCRLMDGDIRVQSTLGEGSTFTVTLPLKLSQVDLSPKPVAVSATD